MIISPILQIKNPEIQRHKVLPKGIEYRQSHSSHPAPSKSIKAHVLTTTLDCTGNAEHLTLSLPPGKHEINVRYPHHHQQSALSLSSPSAMAIIIMIYSKSSTLLFQP